MTASKLRSANGRRSNSAATGARSAYLRIAPRPSASSRKISTGVARWPRRARRRDIQPLAAPASRRASEGRKDGVEEVIEAAGADLPLRGVAAGEVGVGQGAIVVRIGRAAAFGAANDGVLIEEVAARGVHDRWKMRRV